MNKKRHSFLSTQFITATISTTLVLVLLGIIVLFVMTAQNLSTFVKENIKISVLINDEMNPFSSSIIMNDNLKDAESPTVTNVIIQELTSLFIKIEFSPQ